MTTEEKAKLIINDIQKEKGCNPVRIFKNMAKMEAFTKKLSVLG